MSNILRTSDAASWCGGKLYGPDIQLCRIWRNDSREVAPGNAFVALKGENTDGHLFVHKAIERGAQILLVESAQLDVQGLLRQEYAGVSIMAVDDTSEALSVIARKYLEENRPKVVGITGSVGKTTTRELAVAVLGKKYGVHSAIRSFNTVVGCSLTILAMPGDTEILVLEFGTSHFGEIDEMTALFPPDFAVITEVAPAHLDGFRDINGVLRAKMEICSSDRLKKLSYNADNASLFSEVSRKCECVEHFSVGYDNRSFLKIQEAKIFADENGAHLNCEYLLGGDKIPVKASLFGKQHAYNVGYAIVAGVCFDVLREDIITAIENFKPIAGRGVLKKLGVNSWVVDEAYNANPSSMSRAIENVLDMAESLGHEPFAVLGGMKELGESSFEWHAEILEKLGDFRKVILYGDEWPAAKNLPSNAFLCKDDEELISQSLSLCADEQVILIKGSNSYGLKKIVGLLTEGANVY